MAARLSESYDPTDRTIVDFSTHLHPASLSLPASARDHVAFANEYIGPRHRDPDAALAWYDEVGIDEAVVSQVYYMGEDDPSLFPEANDALLDVVEAHDRFYGLATLPLAAGGEPAAEEFERCLDEGYHGAILPTRAGDVELNDEAASHVFDVAESRDAPIFVHPELGYVDRHADVFDSDYMFDLTMGREFPLAESVCKVINDGVYERHPDLKLVYHHIGGGIANWLGVMELRLDEDRFPGQEGVKSYDEFTDDLERVYFDTASYFGHHTPVRATLESVPSTQVVFGSDAPYHPRTAHDIADWVETIDDLTSGIDADRIFEGNARDLLYTG